MLYDSLNRPVFQRVPASAARVLDLGCGVGTLGRALKAQAGRAVVGVTASPEEADVARSALDQVVVQDLNRFDPAALGAFDCIICSHVLEHLIAPEILLRDCVRILNPGALLLVALPNILFWKQRLAFLAGRFRYTEGGLMDRTHFRFFDWNTAQELIESSGYELLEGAAEGNLPLSRFTGPLRSPLNRFALQSFPGVFGFQFVFTARPR